MVLVLLVILAYRNPDEPPGLWNNYGDARKCSTEVAHARGFQFDQIIKTAILKLHIENSLFGLYLSHWRTEICNWNLRFDGGL